MASRFYTFHGLKLAVSGPESVTAALQARLGQFPSADAADSSEISFEFHQPPDAGDPPLERPLGPARTVLEGPLGATLYFEAPERFYLDFPGRARALCEIQTGRVVATAHPSAADSTWLLTHPLFTIPLAEFGKRRGHYMLHAAGLAVDGRGILFAGTSGVGKTTIALALLRAGFGFLGDDTLFLRPQFGGYDALAFPDEMDVTQDTASFFPELRERIRAPSPDGRSKRAISAAEVYGIEPTWNCRPALLIFPKPASSHRNRLMPMSKGEALLELGCNVLRTERVSSQAHLDALAGLVRQCSCYRMGTSRDFDALPDLFRAALQRCEGG